MTENEIKGIVWKDKTEPWCPYCDKQVKWTPYPFSELTDEEREELIKEVRRIVCPDARERKEAKRQKAIEMGWIKE